MEAVTLTYGPEATIPQVVQDLGINASMLGRWRRQLKAEGGKRSPATSMRGIRSSSASRRKTGGFAWNETS